MNQAPLYPTSGLTEVVIQRYRIQTMLSEIENFKKELKHYSKLAKRWKRCDFTFRLVSHVISGSAAISGAIIVFVPTGGIAIPISLAVMSAGDSLLTELISAGFTSRKINKYKKKALDIDILLHELKLFISKASDDNIITEKELEDYSKLIKDFKKQEMPKNEQGAALQFNKKELQALVYNTVTQQLRSTSQ